MDSVRTRRVAEIVAQASDDTLAWMLEGHKVALEQYRDNLEFEEAVVAALEAEIAGREKRGQG